MDQKAIAFRIIGFLTSLIVTLFIYSIIVHPEFFHLSSDMAVTVIFVLAALLALLQSVFLLDFWSEKDFLWNVGFLSPLFFVIGIIIVFTLWIMESLNYNMMPM